MDLSVETVRSRLDELEPRTYSRVITPKRAAVSMLLRYQGDETDPQVLLMRRARHETDRWSGHVSMPGGREETEDESLLHTALRETREEVGLDLEKDARLVGPIDAVRAIARGKVLPMSITPYVFVEEAPRPPVLNYEVAEVFWLPLGRAASGELDDRYPYRKGPLKFDLPCWSYEGQVIWGLTYDMLSRFLSIVRGDL